MVYNQLPIKCKATQSVEIYIFKSQIYYPSIQELRLLLLFQPLLSVFSQIQFLLLMRKAHTSLEHHTIFAINPSMMGKTAMTSLKLQSGADMWQQKKMDLHINMPRRDSNNWVKSLQKDRKRDNLSRSTQAKKKKMLIQQIEDGLPDMKVESAIESNYLYKDGDLTFHGQSRKNQQLTKSNKKLVKNVDLIDKMPIRKISVLYINSSKSINQQISPQISTKDWFKNNSKIPSKNTIFMPVASKTPNIFNNSNAYPDPIELKSRDKSRERERIQRQREREVGKERKIQIERQRQRQKKRESKNKDGNREQIEEQFNNSHYNNKKYENKRFYTDTQVNYEKQLDFLKEQLRKSQIIINSMKIKELEGQIIKLKEKDKFYSKIIANLAQRKDVKKDSGELTSVVNPKSSLKRVNSEQKQVTFQIQQGKDSKSKKLQSSRVNINIENSQKSQKRSKTQMKQSTKPTKKLQKPTNFHILADHQKQAQTQKQFLLIDPKKTRQKLQTYYNQLKKQSQPPQLSINSFRIPKIPQTHPQSTHSLQTYIQLSNQLCKSLDFNISEMNIVIRKYKNCISFKIVQTGDQVVWGFDGKLYVGGWKEDGDAAGVKNGKGMEFTNNYCYKGQYRENKRCGNGVTQFYNGNVYEGQWKDNKMQGKGVYFEKSSGIYYEGNWQKGQLRGRGTIKYNKKHYFTGQISNFTKSGKGTQYFENGNIYEGSFQKGFQSGYGIYYCHDGQFYVGNFKNSHRNGIGLLLTHRFAKVQGKENDVEHYYYGDFVNGNRCGYGIERTLDNSYYLGYFLNNLAHGPGILQNQPIKNAPNSPNILKLTGIWKNGKIIVKNKNVEPSQKSQSRDFSQVQ